MKKYILICPDLSTTFNEDEFPKMAFLGTFNTENDAYNELQRLKQKDSDNYKNYLEELSRVRRHNRKIIKTYLEKNDKCIKQNKNQSKDKCKEDLIGILAEGWENINTIKKVSKINYRLSETTKQVLSRLDVSQLKGKCPAVLQRPIYVHNKTDYFNYQILEIEV